MNIIIYLIVIILGISVNLNKSIDYEIAKKSLQYIKKIERKCYVLDKHNFISFSDSEYDSKTGSMYKHLVYFSQENNLSEEVISTIDFSDGAYEDTLLFYRKDLSGKQVIIWKLEDEYWSYLNIYLFDVDSLKFIGDLCVGLDYYNCDGFNFPIKNIKVRELTNKLIILFTGEAIFRGSISQKKPYHKESIKTYKLELIYDGINSEISY